MEQLKEFVMKYFKIIVVVLSFSLTLYIQHVNNTAQIAELETKCIGLEVEIKNQYQRHEAGQVRVRGNHDAAQHGTE